MCRLKYHVACTDARMIMADAWRGNSQQSNDKALVRRTKFEALATLDNGVVTASLTWLEAITLCHSILPHLSKKSALDTSLLSQLQRQCKPAAQKT